MRIFILVLVGLLISNPGYAEKSVFPADVSVVETGQPFAAYMKKLLAAVRAHKMGVVAQACATCGAKAIGVTIAENRVVMIFNPHFAVRMLKASVPAGVEAPLRLYVTENPDGTAVLSYKEARQVFAPYKNQQLDQMASELDQVIAGIVAAAGK